MGLGSGMFGGLADCWRLQREADLGFCSSPSLKRAATRLFVGVAAVGVGWGWGGRLWHLNHLCTQWGCLPTGPAMLHAGPRWVVYETLLVLLSASVEFPC